MLTERFTSSNYTFFDKIKSVDYFLILLVILIGTISVFAIYSTEGGNFSYYTKNHLIRLTTFFLMFLAVSLVPELFRKPLETCKENIPPSFVQIRARLSEL